MKRFVIFMVLTLALVFAALPRQTMAEETATSSAAAESGFEILKGQWVRPDGGYTISISGVDSDGKLDASYANPRRLPLPRPELNVTEKPSGCSLSCARAATTDPPTPSPTIRKKTSSTASITRRTQGRSTTSILIDPGRGTMPSTILNILIII